MIINGCQGRINLPERLIAGHGGFLRQKSDGEPGTKTLWLGLQEIAAFDEGARYARAFGEAGICV